MVLNKKSTLLIGTFVYLSLLLLSIIYFKERVIFADVSYILYNLITEGEYAIQANRFVSVFTQSFGLYASKLGLSLKSVAIIHSAGFIMYYFTIFLILLKLAKSNSWALGLMLFNILMVAMSFYWTPNELIQGMAFVFLYVAFMERLMQQEKKSWLYHIVPLLCLITAIFAHPLIIFATVFGVLYLMLHDKTRYIYWGSQFVLNVAIYLIKTKALANSYDSSAMSGFNNVFKFFTNFDLSGFHDFFRYLIGDYILLSIGAIIVFFYYLITKKYLKLILFLAFFLAYSIIVNLAQKTAFEQYYIESQYLILSFFVILPLVKEIIPKINPKLAIGMISLISIICLVRIQQSHLKFTKKIEWHREFMELTKNIENPKIVIHQDEVPLDIIINLWGSAYEFWLLSTIETGETRSIVISKGEDEFDKQIDEKRTDVFIARWRYNTYESLNPNYFIFKDTSNYYKKMTMKEILSTQ